MWSCRSFVKVFFDAIVSGKINIPEKYKKNSGLELSRDWTDFKPISLV